MGRRRRKQGQGFRQNHGRPGVVYVLENRIFQDGHFKIGCSRRSGSERAAELNREAGTGTPAEFKCVFEWRTMDCGRAEELVFRQLDHVRMGKPGQEYFRVERQVAERVIRQVCADVDATANQREASPQTPQGSRQPQGDSRAANRLADEVAGIAHALGQLRGGRSEPSAARKPGSGEVDGAAATPSASDRLAGIALALARVRGQLTAFPQARQGYSPPPISPRPNGSKHEPPVGRRIARPVTAVILAIALVTIAVAWLVVARGR